MTRCPTLVAASLFLAALATAEAAPTTYVIDPMHTAVMYEVPHMGTSTSRGRFDQKEGTIELDRAAKTGKVQFTFQTGSISTGVPALDTHMRSKEFFDSATYPTATFVGDQFTFDGDKLASVAGTLTMHGKTLPVTLKATSFNCYQSPQSKREVCGGNFTTTITRSQYGVDYGLKYGMADQVSLLITVEAVNQQAQ